MFSNNFRYKIIDDMHSYKCNLSQEEFEHRFKIWLNEQKKLAYSTQIGAFGYFNKSKSRFKIHYRFDRLFFGRTKSYYEFYYIIGNIKKVSEGSCIVNYCLIYDRLSVYAWKFVGLGCMFPFILILRDFLMGRVLDVQGITFLLIGTGILAAAGLSCFFLKYTEKKDDVLIAMNIFEDFLKRF